MRCLFYGCVYSYLGIITVASIYISGKARDVRVLFYLLMSFCIIHFSHGIGYVKGFVDFIVLDKQGIENPLGSMTR